MTDPVRRVNYYFGQMLTVEDLQAEQDYHREMRYLHNRLLGRGVVHGLGVTTGDGATVVVGPGLAIDEFGRELVLPDESSVGPGGAADPDGWRDVTASWEQQPDSFVVPVEECADETAFTRWLERPRLALALPGEGPAGSLILGRVLLSGGQAAAVDATGRSDWRRAEPGG